MHHVGAQEGDGEVQGHRRGRAADEAVGGGAEAAGGRTRGAGSGCEFIINIPDGRSFRHSVGVGRELCGHSGLPEAP